MNLSPVIVEEIVRKTIKEDIGHGFDITTAALIAPNTNTSCVIRAREDGILSGLMPALMAFGLIVPELEISTMANDGSKIKAGRDIARIKGMAAEILSAERTALNFLTHLSGISTLTRKYVDAVKGSSAKICDTRKTLPGLRVLQKYAVHMGGGSNHRFGLDDSILIKDNHIAIACGIKNALRLAKQNSAHTSRIEIEVDNLVQLDEVLAFHEENNAPDIVMLDNFSLSDLEEAVNMIGGKIISEASGGVNLSTVGDIAATGVNYISVGALTHSAPALDIGLDFEG